MKPLSGYARYQTALAKFASAYMDPASKAKMRGEQYLRPTDKAFASVFNGFTEIANTLEALELAEVLIGLPAPKSRRIKKDEYLKFLIGAYLQFYVYSGTLKIFLGVVLIILVGRELLPQRGKWTIPKRIAVLLN